MPATNSLAALLVRSGDLTFVKLFDMYNYIPLTSKQADSILQQNICGITSSKTDYEVSVPVQNPGKYTPVFPIGNSPLHLELGSTNSISVEPRELAKQVLWFRSVLTLEQIVSLCSQSIFKETGVEVRYQQMSDEVATRMATELQFLGNKCASIEIYLNSIDRMQFKFDILQLSANGPEVSRSGTLRGG